MDFPRTAWGRNNAKRCGLEHGFSANCMGAQQCETLWFRAWGFRELYGGGNNAKRCGLKLGISANCMGAQQCEALWFRAWGFRELYGGGNNAGGTRDHSDTSSWVTKQRCWDVDGLAEWCFLGDGSEVKRSFVIIVLQSNLILKLKICPRDYP